MGDARRWNTKRSGDLKVAKICRRGHEFSNSRMMDLGAATVALVGVGARCGGHVEQRAASASHQGNLGTVGLGDQTSDRLAVCGLLQEVQRPIQARPHWCPRITDQNTQSKMAHAATQ